MKYRKKPVVVEAVQLKAETGSRDVLDENCRSQAEIAGWMMSHGFWGFKVHGDKSPFSIAIETLEGIMIAEPGDYIIRGVQGEFYPRKPEIFEATYEVAE